jgi:hypothetical protein
MDNKHYFECHCYSPEHLLTFYHDNDDDLNLIFANVFLLPQPWYKRIWLGLKYIFGYQCRYGHFGEFVLNPEDTDRFIEMLQKAKRK